MKEYSGKYISRNNSFGVWTIWSHEQLDTWVVVGVSKTSGWKIRDRRKMSNNDIKSYLRKISMKYYYGRLEVVEM